MEAIELVTLCSLKLECPVDTGKGYSVIGGIHQFVTLCGFTLERQIDADIV